MQETWETQIPFLGQEDPLEEEMATQSSNSSYPGVPADMALPVEDLGSQPHLPGAAWTPSPCRTMTV